MPILRIRVSTQSCLWKQQNVKCANRCQYNEREFFFVLRIVIQLRNANQQMNTFQINVLIQFLVSSTCFEHHVLIFRVTICTSNFVCYVLYIDIRSLAGGRVRSVECTLPPTRLRISKYKTYHTKLLVHMVTQKMSTWCSKHVEDTKNWIKIFTWKVRTLLVYIT